MAESPRTADVRKRRAAEDEESAVSEAVQGGSQLGCACTVGSAVRAGSGCEGKEVRGGISVLGSNRPGVAFWYAAAPHRTGNNSYGSTPTDQGGCERSGRFAI